MKASDICHTEGVNPGTFFVRDTPVDFPAPKGQTPCYEGRSPMSSPAPRGSDESPTRSSTSTIDLS